MNLDSALAMSNPDFSNIGGEYLVWDDVGIGLADFLNVNAQTTDPYLSPGSSTFAPHSTPSTEQEARIPQGLSSPNFSIPRAPNSAVRSLVQRPRRQAGAQRISSLILHTLKSYPLMMLRHETLPPFIHPSLVSSDIERPDMEPLTNCISLVNMISSRSQGSRKLFWKNVQLECEHLFEDVR